MIENIDVSHIVLQRREGSGTIPTRLVASVDFRFTDSLVTAPGEGMATAAISLSVATQIAFPDRAETIASAELRTLRQLSADLRAFADAAEAEAERRSAVQD